MARPAHRPITPLTATQQRRLNTAKAKGEAFHAAKRDFERASEEAKQAVYKAIDAGVPKLQIAKAVTPNSKRGNRQLIYNWLDKRSATK
jgi:hypothetical protein